MPSTSSGSPALLLIVLAAACEATAPATTPEAPRSGGGSAITTASAVAESGTAPGRPAAEEIEIATAGEAACVFDHDRWSGTLHLRPDGPAFARINHGPVSVSVPLAGGAPHVTSKGSLELSVIAPRAELFLTKPLALGGFIVPFADTAVGLAAPHSIGKLNVTLDISDVFELPEAVHQELPCSALTSVSAAYDAARFVKLGTGTPAAIAKGAELRQEPDGAATARLRRTAPGKIVATRGAGSRRIVVETGRYYAVGWISAEGIDTQSRFAATPRLKQGFATWTVDGRTTCSTDIDVMSQIAGQRAKVGKLIAGAAFSRVEPQPRGIEPGFIAITAPVGWLRMETGAFLLVQAAQLEACKDKADAAQD